MKSLKSLKRSLRFVLNYFDINIFMALAVKYKFFSKLYYFIYNNQFDREQQAVLAGKLAYIKSSEGTLSLSAALRRNIHRIEKGLISNNPKPVFAEDYIQETVDIFCKIIKLDAEKDTLKWANDVLSEYFKKVQKTKKIHNAEQIFRQEAETFKYRTSECWIPYKHKDGVRSYINYPDFLMLCQQRRSVRYYTKEKVQISSIQKAIEAAALSPSACNRQPFRFVIINEAPLLEKISKLPRGADSFAENIPLLTIIIGDLSAYFDERDRHIIYIDGGLAAMNYMMALETLGLSSCPINWPDIEELEVKLAKFLKLKKYERALMFISVGYALEEGKIPYSKKRSFENITLINPI